MKTGNVLIGAVKAKKIKAPKFTYGDMVYGWENPDKPGKVFRIILTDDPEVDHKYRLTLKDKNGYTYSSKPVSEKYLTKRKKSK
jgi:hypothetical protein